MAVFTAVLYQVLLAENRAHDYDLVDDASMWDFLEQLVDETVFDMRFCLPALAPLADDVCLTRIVLGIDASLFVVLITESFYRASGGEYASLTAFERAVYGTHHAKNAAFVLCAAWAALQPAAPRMQAGMWGSITLYAAWNALQHGVQAAYEALVLRVFPSNLGQVIPNLLVIGLAARPQVVQRLHTKLRRRLGARGAVNAAASIACLIGPSDPKHALQEARRHFCCVSLDRVSFEDMRDNLPSPALHARSESARLGRCDVFVSHSWHDDAPAKWTALQGWRRAFRTRHQREPRVWLDKCCIDQSNIERDLRCLPIFLSGCDSLLILCGTTYLARLWCIIEIFSFIMMGRGVRDIELVPVLTYSHEEEDMQSIVSSFAGFSAENCKCFDAADKERMMLVIRTAFTSVREFDGQVSLILERLRRKSHIWREAASSDSVWLSSSTSDGSDDEDSRTLSSSDCSACGH